MTRYIHPEDVYGPNGHKTFLEETYSGIGAQDRTPVSSPSIVWDELVLDTTPQDMTTAGHLYAEARNLANEMRERLALEMYGDSLPESSWAVPRG
jgi:hypothetical protein